MDKTKQQKIEFLVSKGYTEHYLVHLASDAYINYLCDVEQFEEDQQQHLSNNN